MYFNATVPSGGHIAQLWGKDPERLPKHVQRALSTPPSGHVSGDDHYLRPCTDGVFTNTLPLSADDVDEYISNARFPYTRCDMWLHKCARGLETFLHNVTKYSLLLYTLFGPALFLANLVLLENRFVFYASLIFCVIGLLLLFCEPSTSARKRSLKNEATRKMKEIERRSVNVSKLGIRIPEQAWNIYLYDRDHYNTFVAMCVDMLKVDAEPHGKTRQTQREILNAFYEMSTIRQKETKRTIDNGIAQIESINREAEEQERQRKEDMDAAQAEALKETLLNPMKDELRAMKSLYGQESRG